jgi:hypothetical protein
MRLLSPFLFYGDEPFGWKCSDCGAVFRNYFDWSEPKVGRPSADARRAFKAHDCVSAAQDDASPVRGNRSWLGKQQNPGGDRRKKEGKSA